MGKIFNFQQLEVWQEAHALVLMVYQVTQNFPSEERFGLIAEMRKVAISVPANIAEGFKRRGIQDKVRFYNTSESSLEKLKYFFILSKDIGYISSNDDLMTQSNTVGRLLNGLIISTKRRR